MKSLAEFIIEKYSYSMEHSYRCFSLGWNKANKPNENLSMPYLALSLYPYPTSYCSFLLLLE